MARTKRSQDLDTRTKRLALPQGKRVTETLAEGRYLLYKRPVNGSSGRWIARLYDLETKAWRQEVIGNADDFMDADGIKILDMAQAQRAAAVKFEAWTREAILEAGGEVPHKGAYTVANAWADYMADAEIRGVHGLRIMRQNAEAHILPALGDVDLNRLTPKRVKDWHKALAVQARRRTGAARKEGEEVEHLAAPSTEDAIRARKDTANRILSTLKAALNYAKGQGHGTTDWRMVKPFHNVTQARIRFLTVVEQRRLVNGCEPAFRALVQGALFTGGRYGELTRVLVQDYNPESGTVFIQFGKAKAGYRPRHVILTEEGRAWFTSHTAGREGKEVMFLRGDVARAGRAEALKDWAGWAAYDEVPAMRKACMTGEVDPVTFHELRHTYASALVNKGVPLAFVAEQLGHVGTRMVERHYGHLCPSAKADSIRLLAPVLGIGGDPAVVPLEIKQGS
jgi:integrase